MIEWFSKDEKTMIATIFKTNITINKPGLDKIDDAYAAIIGFDKEKNIIALKPLSKDDYDKRVYPLDQLFLLSGGKSYTRISSTEFVNTLTNQTKIDFQESKKYYCEYDEKEKMIIIKLNEEVK